MIGVFPSVLKTAKAAPIFKKDSKLDYSNYHPLSLLSNIKKVLEKSMYKNCTTFSIIIITLSITCSLDLGNNIYISCLN